MPLYDYECCGKTWTTMRRIADRHGEVCACGQPARLLISLPAALPEMGPYYDVGLGRRIESRSHRQRVMREMGVVEAGDRSGRPRHGTKGTAFSFPGRTVTSVPRSGAYAHG